MSSHGDDDCTGELGEPVGAALAELAGGLEGEGGGLVPDVDGAAEVGAGVGVIVGHGSEVARLVPGLGCGAGAVAAVAAGAVAVVRRGAAGAVAVMVAVTGGRVIAGRVMVAAGTRGAAEDTGGTAGSWPARCP